MGSSGRILIADPDSRALSLTASGLRKAGFEVVATSRGEEALALLQGEPSLILCEASLEGVDGFALCESARKSPATRDIPFLLLARKDENASRERAKAAGADDFLTKPLYVRDVTTLAQLFAGRRADLVTLEGDLSATPLFYVLRALTSGVRSGVIELPAEQGMLHFRDGRLIEASAGALQGEAAVNRLMLLSQGPFTLRLVPVLLRGSINYSLRDLVSFDEPRRQRFEKAVAAMGGQGAHLVVDIPTLARELPRLPASIERIARLFDGQRTLGEVLRACDLDEVTAAETVLRLFALRIIQSPAAKFILPQEAPHLFEPRNDEALLAMKEIFPEPTDPLLAQVLPEAPGEVRDWFSELGERSSFQDLLAAGTGGWMEVPVERAGEQVRKAGGPLSDEELETRLAVLDDAAKEKPSEPAAEPPAAAPSPAPASADAGQPKAETAEAPASEAAAPAPSSTAPATPAAAAPESPSSTAPSTEPAAITTYPPPPAPARPEEVALAEHLLERIAAAEPQPPAASQQEASGSDRLSEEEEKLVRAGPSRPLVIVGVCALLAVGALFLFMPGKKGSPPAVPAAPAAPVAKVEAPPAVPAVPAAPSVAQPAPGNEPVAAAPASGEAAPVAPSEPAVAAGEAPTAAAPPAAASEPPPPAPKEPAKADAPSESFQTLLAQGKALYEKGRAQAALAPLEKAAALAPDNCDAQVLLALALLDAGKIGHAETAARRALDLDASNARAHLVLGTVHQEHGKTKAARAEYEAYLKLAPSGEYAGDVKAILAELR